MTPVLSVVLSVYNGADYLPRALDSLCRQDGPDQMEVLVTDDGSTDESLAILYAYADKLPLRFLTHPRTGNWVANTNLGIAAAKGRYLCLLHQDDLWLDGRLAWIRQTIQDHPDARVLVSPAQFVAPDGRFIGPWRTPFHNRTERELGPMEWFAPLLVQNYLAIPAPVFRRDLVPSVNPMDDSLKYAADWKLWLELASKHPALHTAVPTVGFRIHPTSQTYSLTGNPGDYRQQLETVYEAFEPLLPPDRDGNQWRAAARLSIAVNTALAATYHRQQRPWRNLLQTMFRTGWPAWHRFFRSSRIVERTAARLKILAGRRTRIKPAR